MKKEDIEKRIQEIEKEMMSPDFWSDKDAAQERVKELNDLKAAAEGKDRYDDGDAVLSVMAGAGGDDAEDFSAMLLQMYLNYIESKNWKYALLHKHDTDQGGYRNVTIEVYGKKVYGTLKNEAGVHRLVRISPFNAKKQRHTSFALVEVTPKFDDVGEIEIKDDDIEVEFSKSGGPGGQNVNKRETAVRITHTPTNMSVHADGERSQAQNKEKALNLLRGKLYRALEEAKKKEEGEHQLGKITQIEWGSQIRSYVLHPYKLVKDHRTGVEVRDPDSVLDGDIQVFIDAEKEL